MKILTTLMILGSILTCNFAHAQSADQVKVLPMKGKCNTQIQVADQHITCSDTPILIGSLFPDGTVVFKLHYTGQKDPALGFVVKKEDVTEGDIFFGVEGIGFGTIEKHTLVDAKIGKCIMSADPSTAIVSGVICAAKDVNGKSFSFDFIVSAPSMNNGPSTAPEPKHSTTVKPFERDTRKFSIGA